MHLIVLFAILCGPRIWATPPPLTSLGAIHALTDNEARSGLPVLFEATVTYYDNFGGTDLFVQDGDKAIYVFTKPGAGLVPGDRVLVKGKTSVDYRADILSEQVTLLRHGLPPNPVPASFAQLIRGDLDCARVAVRARVESADLLTAQGEPSAYLSLEMDGGSIDAMVVGRDQSMLKRLLDAEVEITGVAAAKLDSKQQLTGIVIEVPRISDVKILNPGSTDPFSLPITSMSDILHGYDVTSHSQRVRTRGTVTYYQPGAALVLQNGPKSVWVNTQYEGPLQVGDVVDASGFPDVRNGYAILTRGEIHEASTRASVAAVPAGWADLAAGKYAFDLVSTEGTVLARVRGAAQDEYFLASNGHLFSAIFRHPGLKAGSLPPMKQAPIGSRIRVTGICTLQYGSDPLGAPVAFDILFRSFDDISVIAGPPVLGTRNLLVFVGFLGLLLIIVFFRDLSRERNVRARTSAMAYIESRRSRILEDINGTRPLAEILEQITELVSFKLRGAPCWCQVADGAQLGNCPHSLIAFRVAMQEIKAHSGPGLGILYAAFHPLARRDSIESETLSSAAALARLAIETRRLYSDLRHRSEFDLLTDVHNRFSLESLLDFQIEEARQNAGIFGLIYIDLNDFKQINDVYGHHTGDLYLQAVTNRMKRELRAGDLLARLGGDEFAVLVPHVRNRAEVQEVTKRLQHGFDAAFSLGEYELYGSASMGIALFPEDATSKDGLVKAADSAMYAMKQARRQAWTPNVQSATAPKP